MNDFATTIAEGFSSNIIQLFFRGAIAPEFTNQDYEGEIRDQLSKLNILTFGEGDELENYSGADLTDETPEESIGVLQTDQAKAYSIVIKSLSRFKSWVKNPESSLLTTKANKLKKAIDTYVLGLYGDVGAGNRVGTDYSTGTVTVDVTTGVVTGSGTTFTAAMVGKGFKAAGHSKWYRVKSRASNTEIVIENDSDDETSAYDGGAIGSGASYVIEAVTAVAITEVNALKYLTMLQEKLDLTDTPDEYRNLALPPKYCTLLQNNELIAAPLAGVHDEVVKKGYVGEAAGFRIFKSNNVAGNNSTGYHIIGAHKSWCTFAMGFVESEIENVQKNFGKRYKGLNVYGAKVVDERRKAGAELFCTLAFSA